MPKPLTPEQALQLVALSLGTDELKTGLDLLLYLAHQHATDDTDWDLFLSLEGQFTEYDLACLKATEAWIKRVTGFDAFERAVRAKDRKRT